VVLKKKFSFPFMQAVERGVPSKTAREGKNFALDRCDLHGLLPSRTHKGRDLINISVVSRDRFKECLKLLKNEGLKAGKFVDTSPMGLL
jgi:hypothetical protein